MICYILQQIPVALYVVVVAVNPQRGTTNGFEIMLEHQSMFKNIHHKNFNMKSHVKLNLQNGESRENN